MTIDEPIPLMDYGFNEDGTVEEYPEQMEVFDNAYICSVCRHKIFLTNYCSNCGAKLR